MLNDDAMHGTLGAIYDTATAPAAWHTALRQLCTDLRCHFADSFQRTQGFGHWRGIQVGLDERDYQDVFLGYWVKNNVWSSRRPTRHAGDIVTTRDIISVQDMQRSDMYSQYLRPRQLEEGLRLDIWTDEHAIEDISLLRSWSYGPYTADELGVARMLMPHLQRASSVRRALGSAVGLATAGLSALDHLSMGVVLLRQGGRLAYANAAAETMLAARDALGIGPDGLSAATQAGTRALGRLIFDATQGPRGTPRSASALLPSASGRPPVAAVAMPLQPNQFDPFDFSRPMALLCLVDRALSSGPAPDVLTALFGLTRAEADLTSDLLAGFPIQAIADRTSRSVNTVRTLLARVMAKTDTARQSDLVRILATLPQASLRNPESWVRIAQ